MNKNLKRLLAVLLAATIQAGVCSLAMANGVATPTDLDAGFATEENVTSVPQDSEEPTAAPETSEESTPAESQEPAPVESREPAPAESEEPAPVESREPAPVESEEPAPVESEEPAPVESEEPTPAESEEPAPVESEEPIVPETRTATVTIVWKDGSNAKGTRPESVKIMLNGSDGSSCTAEAKDSLEEDAETQAIIHHDVWEHVFYELPTTANGTEIAYSAWAQLPAGYKIEASGLTVYLVLIDEVAEKPDASSTPVPEESKAPEAPAESEASAEPAPTEEPAPTAAPQPTEMPVLTYEPDPTKEPAAAEEPEATEEPAPAFTPVEGMIYKPHPELDAIANVRANPSASATKIGKAHHGDALTAYDEQDGWYYVEVAGMTGWVCGKYITFDANQMAATQVDEQAEGEVVVNSDTDIRLAGDGMSEIILTIPADTNITVLGVEGDWLQVEIDGVVGYIYKDSIDNWEALQPEQEEPNESAEDVCSIKVTIFTSRRTVIEPGETINLTSKIEGAENYEISLQWQCDKGNGFEDVPGATGDTYSFAASTETLSYSWRLAVYYR